MCSPNRNTANVGQTHRSAPTGAENKRQKIIIQYMKKTYVSPLMVEVNVEAEQMLANSLKMGNDDQTVDTSVSGNQLGKDNGREWGNLWGK